MNNTINIGLFTVISVSMLLTWSMTKPLGTRKRLAILASQVLTIAALSSAHIHQYWVWYYNMHEAEHFVRKMAGERGWFGSDHSKRDEIIGLVFARAKHLGEPSVNVQLATQKVEQLGGKTARVSD
jgi:hypothetical protein